MDQVHNNVIFMVWNLFPIVKNVSASGNRSKDNTVDADYAVR